MSRRSGRYPQGLGPKELSILRECVRFVGGEAGEPFKAELMEALSRGYDGRRKRVVQAIRNASEEQIIAWCESK